MIRSDSINEIAAALAAAQAKFPTIAKDKKARIQSAKGAYEYKYADLADVLSAIRPALTEAGIAICQSTDIAEKGYVMETTLIHSSGQWIGSRILLDRWPEPKQLGIEMTYLRRYAICALAGVASDDDTDADVLEQKGQKRQGKPETPEAPRRVGLDQGVMETLVEKIKSAGSTEELTESYTRAYRAAKDAGDEVAMGKLLAEYRDHPAYVPPQPKTRAVT